MPKIESENQIQTSIKGRNSEVISQNLPICNPRTLLPNINSHSKFEENWLKKMIPAENEKNALTDGFLNGGYNINTPHFLKRRGINNQQMTK